MTKTPLFEKTVLLALILSIFGLILFELTRESFWLDEAYSAWVVRDDMRLPDTPRQLARFVLNSWEQTFSAVRADVHPPLYYFLLDTWALFTGDSDFVLRYLSALLGLPALAGLYALTKRWFDMQTALLAVLFLGTAGFFIYYTREARMYSLYLSMAILATWGYTRWWHRPSLKNSILYSVFGVLLLYTHYTSFTILLAHALHQVITVRKWRTQIAIWQGAVPFLLIGIFFAPWLPFFQAQFAINTGFSASGALPSDLGTLSAIWHLLTSGYTLMFVLALLCSRVILRSLDKKYALLLILLWGILPVLILYLLNASGLSVLQMRYLIPIVPAWAMLTAYIVAHVRIPFFSTTRYTYMSYTLIAFFTLWITYTQLSMFSDLWASKPNWRDTIASSADERELLDPALVYLDERSPLAHYAPRFGLLDAYSINIAWRDFTSAEIDTLAESLASNETLWGILDMHAPASWDAIAALSDGRGVAYRNSVQATVFYAFGSDTDIPLEFAFASASDPIFKYT
ncbi:MAG: glycosyltransferase family 39 protein, partial [Chloroflexota bacterium]